MEQTRFEHRRQNGVVNVRQNYDINTMSFAKGKYSLMYSEIQAGKWDYGLRIYDREGAVVLYKLPGEGNGWFRSENDAILYGLEELRNKVEDKDVKEEIAASIYGRMQHTLDLI